MTSIENTTSGAAATTNAWSDDQVESTHPSIRTGDAAPPTRAHTTTRDTSAPPKEIDEDALRLAEAFYHRYKSACHGMTRRPELQRLFEDTFPSWSDAHGNHPDFSKVVFALAHGMRVVRVIDGGRQLVWKVFKEQRHDQGNQQREFSGPRDDRGPRDQVRDDRREPREFRGPRDQPREFRAPRDDRAARDDLEAREFRGLRDDRAPRDDRRPRDDRESRGPIVHHERADRIPRNDREQEHPQRQNLAEIVSNQQKMIETLMSKVMKMEQ